MASINDVSAAFTIIIIAAFLLLSIHGSKKSPLLVKTTEGDAFGSFMNNSRVWYNLPYAKPPVGNLRYAPPKPAMKYDVQPYDATIDQINNRADCMQGFPGSSLQSEDCLYVDVYAPSVPSKDKKGYPVMVCGS